MEKLKMFFRDLHDMLKERAHEDTWKTSRTNCDMDGIVHE